MFANHNRNVLFDTTQSDDTVKILGVLMENNGKEVLLLILFYD